MSLRPRAAAAPTPVAAPQAGPRLCLVLSTSGKFLQPPSTDVKRKNNDRGNAIIVMLKKDDPANLMANAFDVYGWLVDEVEELYSEERGDPSDGRAAAEDIYDASPTEMLAWFRRVKVAMEEIGVSGPGIPEEDDDEEDEAEEENIRSLVGTSSGGQQLRRLIQAKWMASDDGFRYPRDLRQAAKLSFPKGLRGYEADFYDFLTDDDRSLNTAIVEAMGL